MISLKKGTLQNDAVAAVAARDTVHRGRRKAANMNVVTGNNNGKKDMAQVCSSVGGSKTILDVINTGAI